jgi:hypothetical protein
LWTELLLSLTHVATGSDFGCGKFTIGEFAYRVATQSD